MKNKTEECFRDQKLEDVLPQWELAAGMQLKDFLKAAGYKDIEKYEDVTAENDQRNIKKIALKGSEGYYIVVVIMEIVDRKAPVYFWVEYREKDRKIRDKYVTKSRDCIHRGLVLLHDMRRVEFDGLDAAVEVDYYGRKVEYARNYPTKAENEKIGLNVFVETKDYSNGYKNVELEKTLAGMKMEEVRNFKYYVKEDETLDPWTDYDIQLKHEDPEHIIKTLYREHFIKGTLKEGEFIDELT